MSHSTESTTGLTSVTISFHYVMDTWSVTGQARPRTDQTARRAPVSGLTFPLFCTFQVQDTFKWTEYNVCPTCQLQKMFPSSVKTWLQTLLSKCKWLHSKQHKVYTHTYSRHQTQANDHSCSLLVSFCLIVQNLNISMTLIGLLERSLSFLRLQCLWDFFPNWDCGHFIDFSTLFAVWVVTYVLVWQMLSSWVPVGTGKPAACFCSALICPVPHP
jgi:hypothetical protein